MNALPYTMTNDTITVLHGGRSHLVRKGAPNFLMLRKALLAEDWEDVIERLTLAGAVKNWAGGRFKVAGDKVLFDGVEMPKELSTRIMEMAARGEDPKPVLNFWERLQKNPSMRSVQQLWPFLNHKGIPLTKDGRFLAYKGINSDFTDCYTGTFDNSPGVVQEMPRNKISDDPNEACHYGFHVGALEYARSFGPRTVVVEVDPADVVCIPYDSSHQKMRVCRYKVIGMHNGEHLSSTVDDFEDAPTEISVKLADVPKRLKRVHDLSSVKLLEETMEVLRDYAANGLRIVGASRIPGGKIALVKKIAEVRGGGNS